MTDGAPKPKTPARSMATGCLIAVAIAVVVAALAGFALWKVSKGMDEIAAGGAAWLRQAPGVENEFGELQKVERLPMRFSVQIVNDQGDAWFEYSITGTKASGQARVSMVRRQGEWRSTGARLTVAGRETTIGIVP
ncbi:MAG TPA: cytochrome c oxidase assembly factor Coa1 family protein [Planctomycetota bacterium]|nr:cytochrome c oxidase assembly factor Coa1 family protein [Planctomycetota bacterium]